MIRQIGRLFNASLQQDIETKTAFLRSGKVETFDRYKELVGEIRGLETAGRLFNDALKRAGEVDDDE